jgi:DUF1680 family protein
VYCVEDVDFGGLLDGLTVPREVRFGLESRRLLGGMSVITIDGAQRQGCSAATITAIPYFAWNNRGTAPMAVWLSRGP